MPPLTPPFLFQSRLSLPFLVRDSFVEFTFSCLTFSLISFLHHPFMSHHLSYRTHITCFVYRNKEQVVLLCNLSSFMFVREGNLSSFMFVREGNISSFMFVREEGNISSFMFVREEGNISSRLSYSVMKSSTNPGRKLDG